MVGRPRSVSDDAIFEAVAATVTAIGPSALTLAAVAERAGLSAPALTQRFGSKRGLLIAFARREATSVTDAFAAGRATHNDPLTVIIKTLSALPSGITSRESLANNLAFLQMDLTDPELRSQVISQSRAWRAEIAALVTEAVDLGHLTPTTSPEELATDLYAVYSGAMVTWAVDGTGKLTEWLSDHLERAITPHRAQVAGDRSDKLR